MKIDLTDGMNVNGLMDMLNAGIQSGRYNPDDSLDISIDPKILQDKEFKRFCLKSILSSLVLSRKDFHIASNLYRILNLYDNKKLLEALKTYKKVIAIMVRIKIH